MGADAETHSQTPLKPHRSGVEREGLRTGEHSTQSQLSRAHRRSQRLNEKTWTLYGTELIPLHIHYGCVDGHFCGTPNSGSGGVSDSFAFS